MFLIPVSRHSAALSRSWDRVFDDRAFDRFFAPTHAVAPGAAAARSPALELTEAERSYTIKLDLPGMGKDDVKINIEGRRVTVEASTSRDAEKKDGDRVVYSERSMARYARSFTLPVDLDQAESAAKMDNGVLTLTLAKRSALAARQLAVS